jgi:uncharacterized protein involved in cysteine biosynthesis
LRLVYRSPTVTGIGTPVAVVVFFIDIAVFTGIDIVVFPFNNRALTIFGIPGNGR